jgi:hypothetical protein
MRTRRLGGSGASVRGRCRSAACGTAPARCGCPGVRRTGSVLSPPRHGNPADLRPASRCRARPSFPGAGTSRAQPLPGGAVRRRAVRRCAVRRCAVRPRGASVQWRRLGNRRGLRCRRHGVGCRARRSGFRAGRRGDRVGCRTRQRARFRRRRRIGPRRRFARAARTRGHGERVGGGLGHHRPPGVGRSSEDTAGAPPRLDAPTRTPVPRAHAVCRPGGPGRTGEPARAALTRALRPMTECDESRERIPLPLPNRTCARPAELSESTSGGLATRWIMALMLTKHAEVILVVRPAGEVQYPRCDPGAGA